MSSLEKYLLTSLVFVFLFVFYRWMKRYLHRNEIHEAFPYVYPFDNDILSGMEVLRIELPQKELVRVEILDHHGKSLRTAHDAELVKGVHSIGLDCRGLDSGSYELLIQFNKQRTSRSFTVKA